jgi:hypothetical protein
MVKVGRSSVWRGQQNDQQVNRKYGEHDDESLFESGPRFMRKYLYFFFLMHNEWNQKEMNWLAAASANE